MRKLISAGLVIIMILFCMTSCGGNNEKESDTQTSDTASAIVLDN